MNHLPFVSNHSDKSVIDSLWAEIRSQATRNMVREPLLIAHYQSAVISQPNLAAALAGLLAQRLHTAHLSAAAIQGLIQAAFQDCALLSALAADLAAFTVRDPAADSPLDPFLNAKGFHALQSWRVAHWLWCDERRPLALWFQNRISEVFAVDIHPAARIGRGVFIDHATGVVIGETATIGDNVSLLHGVTLGGTGKDSGLRHPQVESGVLIGAGAKVLGHIRIGANSRIGAGSVVLQDVPAHSTVVGVPGRVVGHHCPGTPALEMDQLAFQLEELAV